MARAPKDDSQAAWDRIRALGGSGVWESDMIAVSLAGTDITDDDLQVFDRFPHIQVLDLSHTAVGDAGLGHLTRLPALESLILVDTRISASAIERFRRSHPNVEVQTQPPPNGKINPFTGKPS
ncbi:MAG TPA: hypothetical protein VKE74_12675 [Gemmataceae bacterium]|nr:hypothetical protein [Gemmataceae bacterium]